MENVKLFGIEHIHFSPLWGDRDIPSISSGQPRLIIFSCICILVGVGGHGGGTNKKRRGEKCLLYCVPPPEMKTLQNPSKENGWSNFIMDSRGNYIFIFFRFWKQLNNSASVNVTMYYFGCWFC